MKVPDVFIPEKGLDHKTENLKSHEKKKDDKPVKSLTDCILDEGLRFSKFKDHDELGDYAYKHVFYHLDREEIVGDIYIDYSGPIVEIIQFKDAQTLETNMNNLIRCARSFNNRNKEPKIYLAVKDAYACFIFASKVKQKKEIIDTYKQKFGFEEITL